MPSDVEQEIGFKLRRLQSLQLDVIKYHDSAVLLAHYHDKVVPKVREFVKFVQETGNEHRLMDLQDLGYRVELDDSGEVTNVRLRNWGVDPGDWGP